MSEKGLFRSRLLPFSERIYNAKTAGCLFPIFPVASFYFGPFSVLFGPFFPTPKSEPNLGGKKLQKYIELAGLSFHSFRHFFNTRLVANGVNGELVRATVGHESSDMTKHYLHLVPSDLNTVMDVARQIVNL